MCGSLHCDVGWTAIEGGEVVANSWAERTEGRILLDRNYDAISRYMAKPKELVGS